MSNQKPFAASINNARQAKGARKGLFMFFIGTDGNKVFKVIQKANKGIWVKNGKVEIFATFEESYQFR